MPRQGLASRRPLPRPAQAGVDAAQLDSYRQLWQMVAPEEQKDTAL